MSTKHIANILSGILGFFLPLCFAWTIYHDGVTQNIATWSMILTIDGIALVLMYVDGNKKPYLQIGWVLANFAIVSAIILQESSVHWGWVENISVFLCSLAIFLWITESARVALIAPIIAMWVASVPLFVDYLKEPQPQTLWFWLATVVACALAIGGAQKHDFAHTGMAWSALIMNSVIAVLCLL